MTESSNSVEQHDLPNPTRRRFARQAIVGSTVLLSLGNRTAWGADWVTENCISQNTWLSYAPGVGFASVNPGQVSKLTIAEDIDNGVSADRPKPPGLDIPPGYVCRPEPQRAFDDSNDKMLRQRNPFSGT